MKRTIENHINKLIGRYPTEEELQSCINYLDYWADDQTMPKDIECMINDWSDENMAYCVNCGKYHLISEMHETPDGYFCDEECYYDFDRNGWDMHAEARAECACMNR